MAVRSLLDGKATVAKRSTVCAILLIAISFSPTPLHAQVISGTVRDSLFRERVPGAIVVLLNVESKYLTETVSDDQGSFTVQPTSPGTYRIAVSGMGYAPTVTDLLAVESERETTVNILLGVTPIPLDSLEVVVSERKTRLDLVGFTRRQKKGFGYFIEKEEINQSRAGQVTDLLYGYPSIRIVKRGDWGHSVPLLRGCDATIVLDGMILYPEGGDISINELLNPYSIEGIEIYPGLGGVPVEYRTDKNLCGAILIWTR
jgi:hypothetical protein